ncbi:DUF1015 domain-containing protein [Tenacibaculum sp. UWU-22]|uniref:DUF1015 domain-containing protein n=1 Tax=Tenacibaculum sp. UWU-22 TaxID=3234187 RepID=UPI0034DB02A5
MATVKPFKAVRSPRDKVALVSCKSYELYSLDKLQAKLAFNPYTFLHVINPEYRHYQEVSNKERLKSINNRYNEFKKKQFFKKDETPSFYIYQKITPKNSFCGIIAATSVNDYFDNTIKIHESTLKKRELLFENHLKHTGFNAEPILLTYPDNEVINSIIKKYQKKRAEYEFSTTDKNTHLLWIIDNAKDINQIATAFDQINTLYIADGHHRTTSSCLLAENLAKNNPNHTGNEDYNFFMSYLLPESQLHIYEFNRFIKDLNGLTKEDFLQKIATIFTIENRGQELYKPKQKHQFSMYLNGEFYALSLRKSSYKFTNALSKLDAHILYTTVLKPILGINDIRNDSKIIYSQDKSGGIELKTKVDSGEFKVSFGMLPTTIKELKALVDAGLVMPPKTTYIEPKLRNALTIYEF